MNPLQAQAFRQVYRATRCPIAAARAARKISPGVRLRPRSSAVFRAGPGANTSATGSRGTGLEPVRDVCGADLDRAADSLESEAVRRALSGVAIPVFHQGRECGSTVKHSDQLLMFLLKTLRPERYGAPREDAREKSRRPVVLDIDLSAGGEVCMAPGGGRGDEEEGSGVEDADAQAEDQ